MFTLQVLEHSLIMLLIHIYQYQVIIYFVHVYELQDMALDILQEISIGYSKTTFTITGDSSIDYLCNRYGFNVYVEPDTLQLGESCDVIVEPLICGKFEFPDDCILVSGVYDICLSGAKLLKPITLEIQHCVDLETEEQCKSIQFVVAEKPDTPHHFEPLVEGKFFPLSQYGRISRKDFCFFAITYNEVRNDQVYIAKIITFHMMHSSLMTPVIMEVLAHLKKVVMTLKKIIHLKLSMRSLQSYP